MSFWKKIFSGKIDKPTTESHFDKYRKELNELNLESFSDLENLVKPLIRQTTKLEIQPASRPPENSQLESHFGGNPYFEKGEEWPKGKNGKHLEFIFQVFNSPGLELPKSIELVQFFYDWEEFPWDTNDNGWLVKTYKQVEKGKTEFIAKPVEKSKFCKIEFKQTKTLPDWEGVDLFGNNASKLSCVLNEDEPWDSYDQIVTKLIEEQDYQSQLGGYPKWVQGESTPKDNEGNPMRLLFQIDSEDNAGLMWGDVGLIYVFYDEKSGRIEFTLQCH
ncbi:YwqG family protein [uncultured Tenacibaculum sp.]|uniref:YwqG family protein n=1 Tax=uncultured Tenacibaculum sp. TaxID=174713 RepID=UPI002608681B|nr:YwqG family protein [uncultured Tenacibaculum sp.]